MGLFTKDAPAPAGYAPTFADKLRAFIGASSQATGEGLLGKGTAQDATEATQEAYRQHVIEAATNGQAPLPYADFVKQRFATQVTPTQ